MAEASSSESKRSRISLSLGKKKKKKVKGTGTPSTPSASSSIISFFNNVPPAKITCPVCGQMVPRCRINEHMDETCQTYQGEIGVIGSRLSSLRNERPSAASVNNNSSSYFSKNLLNLETSPPKSSILKIEGSAAQQISPYFSNSSGVCSVNSEPQPQTVKIVSLGSLSSKLSRRRCVQGGKQIVYKEINSSPPAVYSTCKSAAVQDDDEIDTRNSSQKENWLAQRECQDHFSKKESEFQEEINKCDGEDFVDIIQVSLPTDNCSGKTLPISTRSTKTESKSGGVVLGPDKSEAHLAIYTSAKLTHSMEVKIQPHTEVVPPSKTEMNCGTQNCLSKGNVRVLPVEVHGDFKDEIDHTLPETVGKVEFQNNVRDILDKLQEATSVSGSPRHPYYLQNFLVVLRAVLENEDDVKLFDEQDMKIIAKFCKLSVGGQKLYVRLFQRKLNWLKVNKIEYGEISMDLSPIIEELAEARFLQTESELEDLCEGLDLLSAPELKTLAKVFHLPNPNGQKQQLVDDFLRLAKQRSVFSRSQAGIGTVILKRYATAAHMSNDIATAMVNGNWEEANHLYMCAKETWNDLKNHPSLSCHRILPEYLRRFTVGWVYTRILSQGVEILQRLHMYKEAVQELQTLLSQDVYCTDSRGRWWDRLALNLHQHLKNPKKAITIIRNGLADPFVRTGHRLALYQRALRIRDSPSCKQFRCLVHDLPVITVEDVTHVTIKGNMCPQMGMGKSVFLMEDICEKEGGGNFSASTVMCSVEELALNHYRQHGFDQGIHGEGSTFITLYGILMWDIIFMDDIPDVFRNSYQMSPLDLYTDSFYESRRDVIEARLQQLHSASSETLGKLMADIWTAQEGKAAALVSWGRFTSLQQAQSLVSCLGGMFLSGVFRRLSKDLRHCRGGLPDLVVWCTHTHQFKLVEVKGPNDRLSHKQILWLSELKQLGATVEVCHVQAVGGKSKRLS
ncbi:fanconi-associated nuclease 1 isoform X3 [Heliangelus exortis]|uniref:fanconi-associated nuclease 1 isoform X3 n=1 Tax=Heliangelus exortis TaxID=472823 RepID=UPI003A92F569